jgi:hypothetical protein
MGKFCKQTRISASDKIMGIERRRTRESLGLSDTILVKRLGLQVGEMMRSFSERVLLKSSLDSYLTPLPTGSLRLVRKTRSMRSSSRIWSDSSKSRLILHSQ